MRTLLPQDNKMNCIYEIFEQYCVILSYNIPCCGRVVMTDSSVVVVSGFCSFYHKCLCICNKCIGSCNIFIGFLMWGRVPGWRLVSRGGVLCCGGTPVQIN